MATRKKEIKKPSFIITYAVCLLVSLIVLGCFGTVIGVSQYYLFYDRAWGNMVGLDADLTTEICNFLSTDKEDMTREKIVWLKWVILNNYSETGRCAEVYYDKELIADARSTLILNYTDFSGKYIRNYTLEIADEKYLEHFNTPEVNEYYNIGGTNAGLLNLEGLKTQPVIEFYCDEFYADLEN